MDVNFTKFPYDYFEEVYDNPWLNWSAFGFYILGMIGCALIVLVIWFERTGQAGPNRTLLNQLVIFNLDQALLFVIVGTSIRTMRGVIGPFHEVFCAFATYTSVFTSVNMALLALTRTAFKFVFVFHFNGVPYMEDKFLAIFIYICSSFISILATLSKIYIMQGEFLSQKLCDGNVPELFGEVQSFPVAIFAIVVCFVCHIGLTVPVVIKKVKGSPNEVVPFNHQHHQITDFGGVLVNWVIEFLLFIGALISFDFKRTSIEELKTFHGKLLVHLCYTIIPCVNIIVLSVLLVCTKKYLRQAIKGIFE